MNTLQLLYIYMSFEVELLGPNVCAFKNMPAAMSFFPHPHFYCYQTVSFITVLNFS